MITYKTYTGDLPNKVVTSWCEKYKKKLESNIHNTGNNACHAWTGPLTCGKHKYGRFRFTNLISKKYQETSAHRAYFMISNRLPQLEPKTEISSQYPSQIFEVSHLCHNTVCLNMNHLSYEPRSINLSRKTCKLANDCSGHGIFPNCMLQ